MFCPYFGNKDRAPAADIIFMPYNYLIDEKIRENFDIQYQNSIIIFDEAHNIASCAEDVASFEIKSK
jgi:regulator of telomere elongation helicase 1